MARSSATVVVTQRERFSTSRQSLESLLETVDPAQIVLVDGASPAETADFLSAKAREADIRLIRKERFLSPNQARNIGLAAVDTDYVAFVENDVLFTEGWLDALVRCAEETGADVVAPLICQGLPAHETIHHAGGRYHDHPEASAFFLDAQGEERDFIEDMIAHGEPLEDHRDTLKREPTGYCEFHCVLVRRSVFEKTGPFDENMLSTKEHIDFCMGVHQAGGRVYFEPASVVTYVFPCGASPLERADWPFFALRWSDDWGRRSLEHFHAKWRLKKTEYIADKMKIYSGRRMEGMVRPLVRRLPIVGQSKFLTRAVCRVIRPFERLRNAQITAAHARSL
ncbi:MAG: glycosyltransferase [Pseudomonadota bacterium]